MASILTSDAELRALLERTRTIAVLGIKPESHGSQPAYYVPEALADAGFDVIPVPVYFPEAREILGRPVHRSLGAIGRTVDLVDVFRRPADLEPHLPDILAAKPRAVWLQSGIRHDAFARRLVDAGIDVVQDRCLMVDQRRLRAGPAAG